MFFSWCFVLLCFVLMNTCLTFVLSQSSIIFFPFNSLLLSFVHEDLGQRTHVHSALLTAPGSISFRLLLTYFVVPSYGAKLVSLKSLPVLIFLRSVSLGIYSKRAVPTKKFINFHHTETRAFLEAVDISDPRS